MSSREWQRETAQWTKESFPFGNKHPHREHENLLYENRNFPQGKIIIDDAVSVTSLTRKCNNWKILSSLRSSSKVQWIPEWECALPLYITPQAPAMHIMLLPPEVRARNWKIIQCIAYFHDTKSMRFPKTRNCFLIDSRNAIFCACFYVYLELLLLLPSSTSGRKIGFKFKLSK
jgi:hypothetical protein